ncbi:HWE histidine kinase domain-containing protein [Roseomonas sp. AR75]|uniref:HWE histidine kinase domain-containing protein n=1 Tax=Roseomonas sp. AR75 TaxID=2562311 RepID=UPI0010C0B4BC|nr:HWE histidine kinase domain-containing protein [Roseomonas sp. AR75]
MAEASLSSPPDLSVCDREPIHLLGAIQPQGLLLAAGSDWRIARVSANAPSLLGLADPRPEAMAGLSLRTLLAPEAVHAISNLLGMMRGGGGVQRAFRVPMMPDGPAFDLAVHVAGNLIVVEAEPSSAQRRPDAPIGALLSRLKRSEGLAALHDAAVRQLRLLTGFDRVMLYRFLPDGAGEVVAEARQPGLESFLGLRYPATDIPAQARILYLRNLLRSIGDIGAEPVPIVPALDAAGQPLDLSDSVLRSVSPVHVEYLRNMGVQASLSVSVVQDGKLWGLFACHHMAPRTLDFEQRTAVELLGQVFSLVNEAREREAAATAEAEARRAADAMMARLAAVEGGTLNLVDCGELIGELIPCDGVAVLAEGQERHVGSTPTPEEFAGLVAHLASLGTAQVLAEEEIGRHYPPGRAFVDRAAGMLVIPISRLPRDYIVLFRRETARRVTWAGDPRKVAAPAEDGVRLSPRKSFAAWVESVRGRAEAWNPTELRIAESLRISLLEVLLRMGAATEEERRRAQERQELLIAELNHRVRNILALIRALVTQTRGGARDLDHFAEVLGGRIQALARAHDQITTDAWGPAPLSALVAAEAEAFVHLGANRVRMDGPAVLLEPAAFSAIALVCHELMTNSAKYGALSDRRGHVKVSWRLLPGGDLALDWLDVDGPPVRAPTRRGFGTSIIERLVPHDLGGTARLEYALTGMSAAFCVPRRFIARGAAARPAQPQRAANGAATAPLSGIALLVEDNLIVSMHGEEVLRELGAERVEIASSVAEAMRLIEAAPPRLALLDVNLGEETSLPVAVRLKALGIPFVFATGYGEELRVPSSLAGAPVVKKPYVAADVGARVAEALRT